jgi:hypothetical protein
MSAGALSINSSLSKGARFGLVIKSYAIAIAVLVVDAALLVLVVLVTVVEVVATTGC